VSNTAFAGFTQVQTVVHEQNVYPGVMTEWWRVPFAGCPANCLCTTSTGYYIPP
jgi:hypothetical protein